jgi:energy-coupling factor transport system permease protein
LPLALADAERIREAARLRGPAAAPVSGPEMARRLLAGTLDRAVEVAATLEIRGYNLPPGPHEPGQLTPAAEAANREKSWVGRRFAALHARRRLAPRMRSRFDRRFWLAGLAVAAATIASWLAGIGAFEAYPSIVYSVAPAQLALAALFCLAGLAPLRREATRG